VNLEVVILSKGRSETIRKHSLSLFPYATVVIDEAERGDYENIVPEGQLLTHPSVAPLPAIRNWVLDTVKADCLVMADDDVVELKNLVGWRPRPFRGTRGAEISEEVLVTAAQCCLDSKIAMFGFNQNPHPMTFKPYGPLTLNKWVGSVFGLVGDHGLRFDEELRFHHDIDLCLQSLAKHRIIWRDDRWAFVNLRHKNRGGLALTRTEQHRLDAQARLKGRWGQYVGFKSSKMSVRAGLKGKNSSVSMTVVRVPRKSLKGAM